MRPLDGPRDLAWWTLGLVDWVTSRLPFWAAIAIGLTIGLIIRWAT